MIFQRALRRELTSTSGAVFATLFTITLTFMLIRILGQAAGGKIASSDVLALIGFSALNYLPILLILTGFIAVLMVVTRTYQDSEMVVWFASGQSLTAWIRPVMSFGFPIILLTGLVSFYASPWANRQSTEFKQRFEQRSDISKVAPGKFQESASSDRVFFVEEVAGNLSKVQNVFIRMFQEGKTSVIVAKEGTVEFNEAGDKFLIMREGRRYDGLATEPEFQMMQFQKYGVLVSGADSSDAVKRDTAAKSLPLDELLVAGDGQSLGELLWRISLPLVCAGLMLLAVPLGYVNPRVGRSANLIVALLVVIVYINLINIMQSIVVQGKAQFQWAWWPVHAAVFLFVVLLFAWRMTVNSRLHPSVLWCRVKSGFRRKNCA
jgi:lipopolysaccharide export system permease protein